MIRTHGKRWAGGFSLLELLIVVAITLVVAVLAIPRMITAAQNYKLRSTASSVSGLIQNARMVAVSRNALVPVLTAGSGSGTYAYVDFDNSGTMNSDAESASILMPGSVAFDTSGSNPSSSTLRGTLTDVPGLPRFNPRGLPCFIESGACRVNAGKIYIAYLRQDRSIGDAGWAAITVTAAGRVQVFTWDGTTWE